MIEGDLTLNGERMETGAAAQVRDEDALVLEAGAVSELIIVDVALATGGV